MKRQPTTFYRYRAFNATTLEILCDDTVFFAHPGTFNDPMDCNPTLRCDSPLDELRQLLTELIRRRVDAEVSASLSKARVRGDKVATYSARQAEVEASRVLSRIAYNATDPDYSVGPAQAEAWNLTSEIERELRRHYERGVCCFSTSYSNPLLWSHYGDQHKGLCIGYKLDRDPPPTPQRVLYGGDRHISTSSLFRVFVARDELEAKALDRDVLLRKARCCLTGRSTGLATARQPGRVTPMSIMLHAARLPCLREPVNSALGRRTQPIDPHPASMPKLDVTNWENFPAQVNRFTGVSNGPYSELVLGEQANLSQFGVHIERLAPGSRSSFRHWHETEDELVYVVAGEVTLIEDTESTLKAGDAAAWKAGIPTGHCLENRSNTEATVLVVGTRAARGVVHYSDHDVVMYHDEHGRRFCRKDGSLWPDK